MPEDTQYHEIRAAQAGADVRQGQPEHAAQLIEAARSTRGAVVGSAARSTDGGVSMAIDRSRELIEQSYRALADSRSKIPDGSAF